MRKTVAMEHRFTFDTAYVNSSNIGEHKLTAVSRSDFASTAAYSSKTSGTSYFSTFCVELDQNISKNTQYYGSLSYNETTGETKSTNGKVLTLGAAYLYQQFATGALTAQGYAYNYTGTTNNHISTAVMLQNAIHFLTNPSQGMKKWDNDNIFLSYLLKIHNNQDYWRTNYNLNQAYTDTWLAEDFSEYAVFVLQVGTGVDKTKDTVQDQLYMTKVSRSSGDVPEPATMLLWLMGGLSALGYAKKRRKTTSLA